MYNSILHILPFFLFFGKVLIFFEFDILFHSLVCQQTNVHNLVWQILSPTPLFMTLRSSLLAWVIAFIIMCKKKQQQISFFQMIIMAAQKKISEHLRKSEFFDFCLFSLAIKKVHQSYFPYIIFYFFLFFPC